MQKLEAKKLQRMLGRPTHKHVNKMCGAIAAVYVEAKTSHNNFPLGSKFGFSAAILKKEKYIALHNTVATGLAATSTPATTWSFTHPGARTRMTILSSPSILIYPVARKRHSRLS